MIFSYIQPCYDFHMTFVRPSIEV